MLSEAWYIVVLCCLFLGVFAYFELEKVIDINVRTNFEILDVF